MRVIEFIDFILNEMERRGFKQWEADYVAKSLERELKKNRERIEREKPFTVAK